MATYKPTHFAQPPPRRLPVLATAVPNAATRAAFGLAQAMTNLPAPPLAEYAHRGDLALLPLDLPDAGLADPDENVPESAAPILLNAIPPQLTHLTLQLHVGQGHLIAGAALGPLATQGICVNIAELVPLNITSLDLSETVTALAANLFLDYFPPALETLRLHGPLGRAFILKIPHALPQKLTHLTLEWTRFERDGSEHTRPTDDDPVVIAFGHYLVRETHLKYLVLVNPQHMLTDELMRRYAPPSIATPGRILRPVIDLTHRVSHMSLAKRHSRERRRHHIVPVGPAQPVAETAVAAPAESQTGTESGSEEDDE
ncbi:hypothetical protein GGF32_004640 [Allomyces javanicus]|nr:hypothetical protein GGF32_004640 [Allomyces javanicus]